LVWTLEFSEKAHKQLRKLDRPVGERILQYLKSHVAPVEDPRTVGKALVGSVFGEYWRYRVGDYRIICSIRDQQVCILIVDVAHRSDVYRQ
jgi:mRNA interferase RelE/StbE